MSSTIDAWLADKGDELVTEVGSKPLIWNLIAAVRDHCAGQKRLHVGDNQSGDLQVEKDSIADPPLRKIRNMRIYLVQKL